MPRNAFQWTLGRLSFRLVHEDLFKIASQSIVSSDQTDFILPYYDKSTIGGQIWRRWGRSVQDELDLQTGGEIMPLGTVLETAAGPSQRIFHAGFHHPDIFLDPGSPDSNRTEHLRVIRRCVRRILERVVATGLSSVAFPLIGTGIFGLDPQLLAYDFFDEISLFARETDLSRALEVWLAVYDDELFDPVMETGVQAWVDRNPIAHDWQYLHLGVSYLDAFERRVARASDPHWRAFLLTQYAELVIGYLLAVLASIVSPPISPKESLPPDTPISFGTLRSEAIRAAKRINSACEHPWGRFFAEILQRDAQDERPRLERINQDRNNIAHKRRFRMYQEILADLQSFLALDRWKTLAAQHPLPGFDSLMPWICSEPPAAVGIQTQDVNRVGLLERWNSRSFTYVDPNSGVQFKVPAETVPNA